MDIIIDFLHIDSDAAFPSDEKHDLLLNSPVLNIYIPALQFIFMISVWQLLLWGSHKEEPRYFNTAILSALSWRKDPLNSLD